MKARSEPKQSVASMINLGLKSTSKVVANYTQTLGKNKGTVTTLAAGQGQDARKSERPQRG